MVSSKSISLLGLAITVAALGATATASTSIAAVVGKDKTAVDKLLGAPTKTTSMGADYKPPKGFSRVSALLEGDGKSIYALILMPVSPNWKKALKLAGFDTKNATLSDYQINGLRGLPKGWYAEWQQNAKLVLTCKR